MKPEDAIEAESLGRVLELAQKMPERTRRVITLRKVYDYTQEEIANTLSLTMREVEEEIMNAVRFMSEKEIPDGH